MDDQTDYNKEQSRRRDAMYISSDISRGKAWSFEELMINTDKMYQYITNGSMQENINTVGGKDK